MKKNNNPEIQRYPNDASNRVARNFAYERSKAKNNDLLVLMALADYANSERQCYPTVSTLAAHAGVSERTVKRSTKTLVELGEITVEARKDADGAPTSNLYTLTILPAGYKTNESPRLEPAQRYSDAVLAGPELLGLEAYEVSQGRQLAKEYNDDRLLQLLDAYELFGDNDAYPDSLQETRARLKTATDKLHATSAAGIEEITARDRAKGIVAG